jgi:hypothetical protein
MTRVGKHRSLHAHDNTCAPSNKRTFCSLCGCRCIRQLPLQRCDARIQARGGQASHLCLRCRACRIALRGARCALLRCRQQPALLGGRL